MKTKFKVKMCLLLKCETCNRVGELCPIGKGKTIMVSLKQYSLRKNTFKVFHILLSCQNLPHVKHFTSLNFQTLFMRLIQYNISCKNTMSCVWNGCVTETVTNRNNPL